MEDEIVRVIRNAWLAYEDAVADAGVNNVNREFYIYEAANLILNLVRDALDASR